jgi:hypothetical protein
MVEKRNIERGNWDRSIGETKKKPVNMPFPYKEKEKKNPSRKDA